jgi:hypothetical protein
MRLRPATDSATAAVGVLQRCLPEADEILAEDHEQPVFVDPGVNLEALLCPSCRTRLSLDAVHGSEENVDWWHALVEPLDGQNVADVVVTMPCCDASVAFPDLEFDWPAGVASFELSVRNPGVGRPLESHALAAAEAALGCPLREVWAHY